MGVQRFTICTTASPVAGAVSRVLLVSQAVTGPQGTSGTGGDMMKADNLSGLANYTTARSNLGLGSAAVLASTAFDAAGVAAALVDDLSGVSDAATARTNLGLGTAATTAATAYATAAQGSTADTAVQPARSISTTAPLTGGGDLSANRTLAVSAASDTAAGVVELATTAEATTGTDTSRAVTAAGVKAVADLLVPKSLVDAKGDLLVATAADTVARLAVGTNTHVLTADSAEATGVKWAAASGGGSTWSTPVLQSITSYFRYAYYPDQPIANNYGTSGVTADSLYYEPFRAQADCTVTELGIMVSANVASSTIRLGICEIDEDGMVVALVVDAGTVSSATTGFKTVSGLTAALTAGKTYAKMRITTATGVQIKRHECGVLGVQGSNGEVIREITRASSGSEAAGFSSPPPNPTSTAYGSHSGFFHTILMKWTA